ncbi:transposase [Cupriavidus sp. D39]|uniref:IS701 family transposase n=1 Tax=Cupriavidus sp. D39 TaxID=2997877 RepID=UPI00226FE225|nr:transposase [Cupriavidus sp. D39]MCY0852842.1 transposase [Cupriavidus sp. D39]
MSLSNRVRLCLSEWINLLLLAVPIRSRGSFVELLCGCMVSPEGWVTRAISAIARRRHWTTYYKLLGRGSLRTVRLARQLFLLVLTVLPCDVLTLVIDDTLVPRSSEQAPGCAYRHDHSRKINRPQFIRAQCWVTLGVSALGNGGVNLVLLFDSWFMRARLVLPLLRRQMHVIGQARIDTALFLVPPPPTTPRRGRKRIYGERLNAEAIEALPAIELRMPLYGKDQQVRLRSAEARARFLKGALVRAVWCQFFDAKKQAWTKPRLLLASETDLSAQEIVQLYARRWGIEPLFHNLKRWFGVSNLWQQSRTVLELWMQIRSMAWTLNQLLSLVLVETFPMNAVAPWRMNQPVTAGLVTQWLRMEFTGLAFRDGLNRKSQKFQWPTPRNDTRPTS